MISELMRRAGILLIYLIPLLSTVNTCKPSSGDVEPNNTSLNSVDTKSAREIISRLKLLPSENLTEAIRTYDNQNKTLLFGDIIALVELLKDKLQKSDEILDNTMKTLYAYVKNLEMILDGVDVKEISDFLNNEAKLKKFKKEIVDELIRLYEESEVNEDNQSVEEQASETSESPKEDLSEQHASSVDSSLLHEEITVDPRESEKITSNPEESSNETDLDEIQNKSSGTFAPSIKSDVTRDAANSEAKEGYTFWD